MTSPSVRDTIENEDQSLPSHSAAKPTQSASETSSGTDSAAAATVATGPVSQKPVNTRPWPYTSAHFDPCVMDAGELQQKLARLKEHVTEKPFLRLVTIGRDGDGDGSILRHWDCVKREVPTMDHITHPSNEPLAVFFAQTENAYDRHPDFNGNTRVSTTMALTPPLWDWLLRVADPHPGFVDAIVPSCGYYSTFLTYDEQGEPAKFNLVSKTTRNGQLDAAISLSIPLPQSKTTKPPTHPLSRHTTAIIATRDPLPALRAFATRFTPLPPTTLLTQPFTLLHHILTQYFSDQHVERAVIFHATIATEQRTGIGVIDVNLRGTGKAKAKWKREREVAVQEVSMRARSLTIAGEFQVRFTDFVKGALGEWADLVEQREGEVEAEVRRRGRGGAASAAATTRIGDGDDDDERSSSRKGRLETRRGAALLKRRVAAMQDALRAHRAKVVCLVENMKYYHSRAQIQTVEISALNNRHTTLTMKVIAFIQTIYLPSTFVAQLFSTGFFSFPQPRHSPQQQQQQQQEGGSPPQHQSEVTRLTLDPSVWYMVVVGLVFTLGTGGVAWVCTGGWGVIKEGMEGVGRRSGIRNAVMKLRRRRSGTGNGNENGNEDESRRRRRRSGGGQKEKGNKPNTEHERDGQGTWYGKGLPQSGFGSGYGLGFGYAAREMGAYDDGGGGGIGGRGGDVEAAATVPVPAATAAAPAPAPASIEAAINHIEEGTPTRRARVVRREYNMDTGEGGGWDGWGGDGGGSGGGG